MKGFIILGILLGSLVVFQPILNRLILEQRGLAFAIWVNATVLFVAASMLALIIFLMPERFPQLMRFKVSDVFSWWFLAPGLFGLMLVSFVPMLIKNIGASTTVLLLLSGQLATSFLWDAIVSGHAFNAARFFGMLLAFLGAYLSFK